MGRDSGPDRNDSADLQTNTPPQNITYPPSASQTSLAKKPKFVHMPDEAAERGHGPYSSIPPNDLSNPAEPTNKSKPGYSRSSSWFDGIRKFEHSYEGFDLRNASNGHLAFADGDIPKNKVVSSIFHMDESNRVQSLLGFITIY
jgi:hypothetical protein